ncbi:MAG: radical SAM protein [Sphaerochaetaceae bacterium]
MELWREPYRKCVLCPNHCEVDRTLAQTGICGETDTLRIAWMGLHRGEEPPVTGEHGSGMVFFCGCQLHCAYCQNCQISGVGQQIPAVELSIERFAGLMLELQTMGATNINMVTGTHFIPSIIQGLLIARSKGLVLPVVWNSSGFESLEGLELIDPYVALYLIDVKTLDAEVAEKFCGTRRYVREIPAVMDFLFERHPRTRLDGNGALNGILIRHLLFPGTLAATRDFLFWFAQKAKRHAWLSLMVQFVPPQGDDSLPSITQGEYDGLIDLLDTLGIEKGFVQDLADNIPWIPDFTRDNPFPETFAEPLAGFLALKNHRPS